MCSHIEKYGPNFDRGMANFMAGILRPQSALEIGCGIGLYINFMERFTTAAVKDQGRFLGVEPEPMVQAKVFGQDPYRAQQLMLNVLDAEAQQAVADLGTFDVVLSSEVIEHIPCDLHSAFLDVLTDRTGKFLVFGAARPGQGGTGHVCLKWTRDQYLAEFNKRGLVHLPILSGRLRSACYNGWDKGQNTFVVANPKFVEENGGVKAVEERLGGLKDVGDLFPEFMHDVFEPIKTKKQTCE